MASFSAWWPEAYWSVLVVSTERLSIVTTSQSTYGPSFALDAANERRLAEAVFKSMRDVEGIEGGGRRDKPIQNSAAYDSRLLDPHA